MARRLIGYAVTDATGSATINYFGQALGNMNFTAESGGEILFEDEGSYLNHTNWDYISGATLSYEGDRTELVQSDQTVTAYQYYSIGDMNGMCFEIDVQCTFTTSSNLIRIMNGSTARMNLTHTRLQLVSGEWKHIKVVLTEDGMISCYSDDIEVLAPTTITTPYNRFQIQIVANTGDTVKYKNFIVYRDESTLVSPIPARILDAYMYDDGIEGYDNPELWYNYNNRMTVSANALGTTLTGASTSLGYYIVNKDEETVTTSTVSILNQYTDFAMEFYIENWVGTNGIYLRGSSVYSKTYSQSYIENNNISYIRVEAKNGEIKVYLNNELDDTIQTAGEELRLGLQVGYPSSSLTFRGFKLYRI